MSDKGPLNFNWWDVLIIGGLVAAGFLIWVASR